jgi:hypothetical protein
MTRETQASPSTMREPEIGGVTCAGTRVERGEFGAAEAVPASAVDLSDARTRYSSGLCRFGAGRRDEGLRHIVAALQGHPGLFPYWPLGAMVDLLIDVDEAIKSGANAVGLSSPSRRGMTRIVAHAWN